MQSPPNLPRAVDDLDRAKEKIVEASDFVEESMERVIGFEPTTLCLASTCCELRSIAHDY
jgi:hypothetical protein